MGGRELPTECPHGRIIDPGDFGESSEGCDACGIPAATWDDDGNIIEEPRSQHRRGPAMTGMLDFDTHAPNCDCPSRPPRPLPSKENR